MTHHIIHTQPLLIISDLRDVRVKIPHTIRRGQKAILKCLYDIEDDTLYAVKWYKGRREFYRYTPSEEPPMQVFQFPGVRVDRSTSNETHLVLDSSTMATAGKYSCEVSADAPSFHTLIAAGELQVVELPHHQPLITGIRSRYHNGDILRGNCTSRHSKPAANLTWTVNNEEVQPSHVRHFKVLRDSKSEMQTSVIALHFVVNEHHFQKGKMKIRCIAQIGDVYYTTTEKIVLCAAYHHHHHNYHYQRYENDENEFNNVITSNKDYAADVNQYALQDRTLVGQSTGSSNNYISQVQDFFSHLLTNNQAELTAWSTAVVINYLSFYGFCDGFACHIVLYSHNVFQQNELIMHVMQSWYFLLAVFLTYPMASSLVNVVSIEATPFFTNGIEEEKQEN
ncbi:hypothetical protein GQX74_011720 [Glossina fuscipes]|nr:hypothetical protein GQX74_011720 [Glossina fuscipes]